MGLDRGYCELIKSDNHPDIFRTDRVENESERHWIINLVVSLYSTEEVVQQLKIQ